MGKTQETNLTERKKVRRNVNRQSCAAAVEVRRRERSGEKSCQRSFVNTLAERVLFKTGCPQLLSNRGLKLLGVNQLKAVESLPNLKGI